MDDSPNPSNNIFTRSLLSIIVVVLKSMHKQNFQNKKNKKNKKTKYDYWLTLLMIFSNASCPCSWMYFSIAVRMPSSLLKISFFLRTYRVLIVRGLTKKDLTKCS